MARQKSDNKLMGALYEQRFILECMERGLHVFSPVEEGLPQDVLVMNSESRVFNVQIKGTAVEVKKWESSRYRITAGYGSKSKSALDCNAVDILAAHVDPDVWYIIPCEELKAVSVWLYPHANNSAGQYESYLERWDLFTEETSLSQSDPYCLGRDAETPCNDSWTDAHEESCVD